MTHTGGFYAISGTIHGSAVRPVPHRLRPDVLLPRRPEGARLVRRAEDGRPAAARGGMDRVGDRAADPDRPVHRRGRVHRQRRDGGGLLDGPRQDPLVAGGEPLRSAGALLLRVLLKRGPWLGDLERRRAARASGRNGTLIPADVRGDRASLPLRTRYTGPCSGKFGQLSELSIVTEDLAWRVNRRPSRSSSRRGWGRTSEVFTPRWGSNRWAA